MAPRLPKQDSESEPRRRRRSEKANTSARKPEHIEPQTSLDLSDELKNQILEIVMNWGLVDFNIELSLYSAYKDISLDHRDALKLLDNQKRMKILYKLVTEKRLPDLASEYLVALDYAVGTYKSPRNIIAHGIFATTQDGAVFLKADGKSYNIKDFDLYVQQSRYAAFAAKWLIQVVMGHTGPPAWPDKPPREPDPLGNIAA